jgi:ATP-binding cassette, subfamily B, multidrug efflux pump
MFGRGPGGGMGMPAEKAMSFRSSGRRLLTRLAPERLRVFIVVLFAIVSVGLGVYVPKVMGHATDIIFKGFLGARSGGAGIDFGDLTNVLWVATALFVLSSMFSVIQALILNGVVQRTRTRGEVLSRVTNDIDNISQSLQQTLSRSINALLTVVGVLAMMFWISPLLAIIGLISVPVSIMTTTMIAKRSQKLFVAQWRSTGELNGHIEEAFTGHSLVKIFGRQKEVEEIFEQKNSELMRASFGAQFISATIMPVMFFIGNLNYVVLAVVGGLRVASGAMTIGDVQAFIQYSRQFTQPLTELASMANTMQSGVASAERVFELLDADELSAEPEHSGSTAITMGRIEFEHVDFSYKPETPLIQDLSFVAEPGQSVAIVGHTGAGTTTLVNLIMRFYEIGGGRITLDHVDTASLSRYELRSKVGMVLQDAWLFEGTIRENIAYGRLDATEEEIDAAAKAAFVDRFVRTLPDGYDTRIDAEASNVSAGEKQLITIARAFLSNPALLILDEATSSVDTRTEVLVQHAMAALRSNRTSFIIAHRLSTIRDADLIIVMDAGRIVEQGSHQELLQKQGAYFELYNAQFTAPTTDAA